MITIILIIFEFFTAIWVYRDSKKYKRAGLTMVDPLGWGLLVFLFWLAFFPIYLTLRILKYQKQIIDPTYKPNKKLIVSIITFFVVISVFVAIRYLLKLNY